MPSEGEGACYGKSIEADGVLPQQTNVKSVGEADGVSRSTGPPLQRKSCLSITLSKPAVHPESFSVPESVAQRNGAMVDT